MISKANKLVTLEIQQAHNTVLVGQNEYTSLIFNRKAAEPSSHVDVFLSKWAAVTASDTPGQIPAFVKKNIFMIMAQIMLNMALVFCNVGDLV